MIKRIAQGGMAEIYLAEYRGDANFVRVLAVKKILPQWLQDSQFVKMIQDEAKLLVQLQHRNIVQVFDLFDDDGAFCISMEYVDGVDLRQILSASIQNKDRIPPKFVYWIVSEVLNALAFAHSRTSDDGFSLGIVHRDISPQNILLAWHGEVKVVDFGIAKGRHRSDETQTGQLKGKFAYMSPEQARGESIDSRSDLFAVGVVMFELLTGTRLFEGDSDLDVLRRVQDVALPKGWEREVVPEIRSILRKALKKNPDERYQTAEEMLLAITHYSQKQGCQIFGMELAPYLRELFPQQQTVPCEHHHQKMSEETSVDSMRVTIKKRYVWPTLSAGMVLALMSGMHSPRASVAQHAAVAAVLPPLPEISQKLPEPTMLEAKTPKAVPVATKEKGKLSVKVRPWGYVTVPGVVNHRESPLGVALNEGNYQVKVFYEPSHTWVSARTTVKPGVQTNCFASFGSQPKISCK